MPKKKNTKLRAIDIIIIIICLTGSALSGAAFLVEYNRTFTKLNEEPVGSIKFKKRTAQRKFIERSAWDRLKQASSIYNGDTIRTIEFSEAVITFRNEVTHLNLYENTLIQVFYDDINGARIELNGGYMEVVSGNAKVVITAGDSEVKVSGQAGINMGARGFSLAVTAGEAVFNGETVETGQTIAVTETGERALYPAIVMKSFGPSARALAPRGEPAPIEFLWTTANYNNDTYTVVEVSLTRNFDRIIQRTNAGNSTSAVINLEAGNYWWRVFPADSRSEGAPVNGMFPSGAIEVIPVNNVQLIAPAQEAQITLSENSKLNFSWHAAQNASSYLIEISDRQNMANPAIARNSERTELAITELGEGNWYWRVTPVYPAGIIGSAPVSGVNNFTRSYTASARQPEPAVETPAVETPQIAATEPAPAPQPEPQPAPAPLSAPTPATPLQPQPVPQLAPQPAIIPEPTQVPAPEPAPEPQPEPPVITEDPSGNDEAETDLFMVSENGTIRDPFPTDDFYLYTGQIENALFLRFSWDGDADEYSFALFNAENGTAVIKKTQAENSGAASSGAASSGAKDSAYILNDPSILTEGDYVWHIYENGEELPSLAVMLHVISGDAPLKTLPALDPGELYGR